MVILVVFNNFNVVKNLKKARPRCVQNPPIIHYYGAIRKPLFLSPQVDSSDLKKPRKGKYQH